jgi:hypothetical protein
VLSWLAAVFAFLVSSPFLNFLLLAVAAYLVLGLTAALLEVKEAKLLFPVWLGIIATHVVYGLSFLAGLIKRDLRK